MASSSSKSDVVPVGIRPLPVNRIEVVWRGLLIQGSRPVLNLTHSSSASGLERLTGYTHQEALTTPSFIRAMAATPTAKKRFVEYLERLQQEGSGSLTGYHIRTKQGKRLTLEIYVQRLRRVGKQRYEVLISFVSEHSDAELREAVAVDETAGINAEDTIRHLAFHDTLTDLPNRALLQEQLSEGLRLLSGKNELSVLFIDLDGFKNVNDTLGHQAGDELLVEVANRLRTSVRATDLVARFGGDEFVVVLRESDSANAEQVASSILTALEESIAVVGREVYISASIGVATAPHDGKQPEELLRNADNALYQAKDGGRRTVRVYNSAMHLLASAKLLMEESLRKAISRNELFLQFQPIQDVKTQKIVAAEILLRWRHPLRDVVLPHEFMPLAEEVGIIEDIGHWMVHAAIRQVQVWEAAGLKLPKIALNISASEFRQSLYGENLVTAFEGSGVDCRNFQLELTESIAVEQVDGAQNRLTKLREAGFELVLDGFGRNHSSLDTLKQLPFSGIKVHQAFTQQVGVNAKEQAILQAVVDLGCALGCKVWVEGVDTAAQATFVASTGCDGMQGHYISPPLSAHDFAALIKS